MSKLKGVSTIDLINMDPQALMKLNEKQLRDVVSKMADAANKRVNRTEKAYGSTPATREARKGGKFSTKDKNLNELREEYKRVKGFLTAKTSTVRGETGVEKQVRETLGSAGITISKAQYKDFWKAYQKLKETNPKLTAKGQKYLVLQNLAREMEGPPRSMDEIIADVNASIQKSYEYAQEHKDSGVSKFFRIK